MNAAGLNGPPPGGEPQDHFLQRIIEALLEGRLDLTLEMYLLRIIRRDVEDGLNFTARLVQSGEDHPQGFGERCGGGFICLRESGPATNPTGPPLFPAPPP